MAKDHLTRLNRDLVAEIFARVDGPSLAAATCSCLDLRGLTLEEKLWEDLCHKTWPSTLDEMANDLISSLGGFSKFYAKSFPLILYQPIQAKSQVQKGAELTTHVSPSDFVSLVDVYYNRKCIFSKVLPGAPGNDDGKENSDGWFLDSPFRLEALNYRNANSIFDDDYDDDDSDDESMEMALPSVPLMQKKERGWKRKLCKKLEENVRLSWVLINRKTRKTVNLSSWKPLLVRSHWPSLGDFVMRFGCVLPAEKGIMASKPVECVISARCRVMERGQCLMWRKIELQLEDMEGNHLDGRKSMVVLESAFRCERSINRWEIRCGYEEYVKEKEKMKEKKMRNEGIVDRMCVCAGIAVFAGLCFFTL